MSHCPFEVALVFRQETAILMHQFRRLIPDKPHGNGSVNEDDNSQRFENQHQIVNMLLVPVVGKRFLNLTIAQIFFLLFQKEQCHIIVS